jgi:hypothetical protein
MTDTNHTAPEGSTAELKLFALMARDCDVLRARELEDEPAPGRSPETRAKIAAAMRGNANRRKLKPQPVVSPTLAAQAVKHRRTSYG